MFTPMLYNWQNFGTWCVYFSCCNQPATEVCLVVSLSPKCLLPFLKRYITLFIMVIRFLSSRESYLWLAGSCGFFCFVSWAESGEWWDIFVSNRANTGPVIWGEGWISPMPNTLFMCCLPLNTNSPTLTFFGSNCVFSTNWQRSTYYGL